MLISKENNEVIDKLPWILALNKGGEAMGWIDYEDSAYYHSKGKILWTLGTYELVLRGGTNAMTGKQSILKLDSIIALDCDLSPSKYRKNTPTLTNVALFNRDKYICAYCGSVYKKHILTRDHIIPVSKGGPDTWENCVTSCQGCNQYKGDKTLEQADMKLIYVPYTPTYNESLILQNRNILVDQMQYLLKGVSKNSRLHS